MGASPQPTGKLLATTAGRDLVLARSLDAAADTVWAELTDPERTALWFGPWSGRGEPGGTIAVKMAFEEGEPVVEMVVEACERVRHLALRSEDDRGSWNLELELAGVGDGTELRLTHHLDEEAEPGLIGPGWEYYLDMLLASHRDEPPPSFDDYFPAQRGFYESLNPE